MENLMNNYCVSGSVVPNTCVVYEGVDSSDGLDIDSQVVIKSIDRYKLGASEFDAPEDFLKIVAQECVGIREHQTHVVSSIVHGFYGKQSAKYRLVMACGTGKMYCALYAIRSIGIRTGGVFIVIVPSLGLVDQFVDTARTILGNWDILLVDSVHQHPNSVSGGPTLIITTYHSTPLVKTLLGDIIPSIVVYDEAHRTCVNGPNKGVFSDPLEFFPGSNKLFMTATPKIVDRNDDDGLTVRSILSMDDESVYGKVIWSIGFDAAIEAGLIVDYKIAVPPKDFSHHDVIGEAMKQLGIHHLLVYSNTCEDSEKLHNSLCSSGISSFYIDGTMSTSKRRSLIEAFKESEKGVLCSVRILSEGISIPIVDSVYFAGDRVSTIDIIQCIGRSLRLHPSKSMATVILPSSMLKNRSLLDTLHTMDPRNKREEFMMRKLIRISGGDIKTRITHDSSLIDDVRRFIKFVTIGRNEGIYEYKLNLCKKYELETNQTISSLTVYEGIAIGTWMNTQKDNFNKSLLSDQRIKMLEQLNTWNTWRIKKLENTTVWAPKPKTIAGQVEIFKACEADGVKLNTNTVYKNYDLGSHLSYLRSHLDQLSEDDLVALRQVAAWCALEEKSRTRNVWNKKPEFNEQIRLFQEFEKLGSDVITTTVFENNMLGSWLSWLSFRIDSLSEDQLSMLNTVRGWNRLIQKRSTSTKKSFNSKPRTVAEQVLLFQDYEKSHGCFNCKTVHNNYNIGGYIRVLVRKFRDKELSDDEIGILNTVETWRKMSSAPCKTNKVCTVAIPKSVCQKVDLIFEAQNAGVRLTTRSVYNGHNVGKYLCTIKRIYSNNGITPWELEYLNRLDIWRHWVASHPR